jgi:molybdopterin-guanine dinucleotide biosynthesis adapter protein
MRLPNLFCASWVLARFDTVIVVDWSAANVPSPAKASADAIWIGVARAGGCEVGYHRTRSAAEAALVAVLEVEAGAGRRVLAGFDFPLGYPEGFAVRLAGKAGPRGVWDWLEAHLVDGPDNRSNRFELAAGINKRFGGAGPFWGRPAGLDLPTLPARKLVDYAGLGLTERRQIELAVPRAQSVWKLYTTGSVGSQSLTGLPMIARLARRPGCAVWPFDAVDAPLVLTEVYLSLLGRDVAAAIAEGEIKDAAQVRLLAQAFWALSAQGGLGALLDLPQGAAQTEEGWILGAGFEALLEGALR